MNRPREFDRFLQRAVSGAFVMGMIDAPALDHQVETAAARLQAGEQRLEIDRPVLLADRLDHLDRDDVVETAAGVAVVLQAQVAGAEQAGLGEALLGEGELL